MLSRLSLIVLGVALSTGCLSASHRISKSELRSLARVAPEQRGDKVRVVQDIGSGGGSRRADRVHGGTMIRVDSPIWIDGRPHHNAHNASTGGAGGGTNSGVHGPGKNSGGPIQKGGGSKVAGDKAGDAELWLIIAAVAAIALAATEGARYDGWVKLHPMHPVHLFGPNGGYAQLPLAQIDEATAAWAHHAVVQQGEGPWTKLGRAPLNRQGFTYSVVMGAGEVPVLGLDADPGFLGHIQFGYFPTHQFGIQLDLGMGWTVDELNNTIFTSRTSLELQTYLVDAGIIHGGLFGQIGVASRFDDGIGFDDKSSLFGAGGILQLELTTRLAITGRVGITRSFSRQAKEFGIGVSIY